MSVFVDTSALYALLDEDDANHVRARDWFTSDITDDEELRTHSYVIVESAALVHRRLGAAAARALLNELVPALDVVFVDASLHDRAVSAYLAGLARRPSLVDRVSFEMMRADNIRDCFAFDRDFATQGFRCLP